MSDTDFLRLVRGFLCGQMTAPKAMNTPTNTHFIIKL